MRPTLLLLVVGAYSVVDGIVLVLGGGDHSKVAEGAFELASGCCDRDRQRRLAHAAVGLGRVHDVGSRRADQPAHPQILL